MGEVILMANKKDNANLWTPEQALEDALSEIKSGKHNPTRVLIITLDDSDNKFEPHFYQSGMKATECLALLEVGKIMFLKEMGLG